MKFNPKRAINKDSTIILSMHLFAYYDHETYLLKKIKIAESDKLISFAFIQFQYCIYFI